MNNLIVLELSGLELLLEFLMGTFGFNSFGTFGFGTFVLEFLEVNGKFNVDFHRVPNWEGML